MSYLADPRTQYGLARAAESRAGVVDRNLLTDFTLGTAEYDEAKALNKTTCLLKLATWIGQTLKKLVDYYMKALLMQTLISVQSKCFL